MNQSQPRKRRQRPCRLRRSPRKSEENRISAILFDWDFTLAYTLGDVSPGRRMAALFEQAGLSYSPEAVEAALLRYQQAARQGKVQSLHQMQRRQDLTRLYRNLLTHLGHPETSREIAYRLYSAYAHLPTMLYDDARPALQVLQQQGLKLGVLSNHAVSVRDVIEHFVGDFIPSRHITISEEVGVHKPSKTIFRRAAGRMRTPPAQCLYVGDNLIVDAVGAVQIGGYGLGLWLDRRGKDTSRSLPPNVTRITSLRQVADFV